MNHRYSLQYKATALRMKFHEGKKPKEIRTRLKKLFRFKPPKSTLRNWFRAYLTLGSAQIPSGDLDNAVAPDQPSDQFRSLVDDLVETLTGQEFPELSVLVRAVLQTGDVVPSKLFSTVGALLDIGDRRGKRLVERFLKTDAVSNFDVSVALLKMFVPEGQDFLIAVDDTEIARCDHTTLMAVLILKHGQSVALAQTTILKSREKEETKAAVRKRLVERLRCIVDTAFPEGAGRAIILGDRNFGTVPLMKTLEKNRFYFILRTQNHYAIRANGIVLKAEEWRRAWVKRQPFVDPTGDTTALVFRNVQWTEMHKYPVKLLVVHKEPRMQDTWTLLCNILELTARQVIQCYATRWKIETGFRNLKSSSRGLNFATYRTKSTKRRDRWWLVTTIASVVISTLGAARCAVEPPNLNSKRTRTFSVFRRGLDTGKMFPILPQRLQLKILEKWQQVVANPSEFL